MEKRTALGEKWFRFFAECNRECIFTANMQGKITYVSPAVEKMLGYTIDEVLALHLQDIIMADSYRNQVEAVDQLFDISSSTPPKRHVFTLTLVRKDGTEVWIEATTQVHCDVDGNSEIMGVCRDITDRLQAEYLFRAERDLGMAIGLSDNLSDTLNICLKAAIDATNMDCGGIYLVDKETGDLMLIVHDGLPEAFVQAASYFRADSENARLIMNGKPIYTRYPQIPVEKKTAEEQEFLKAVGVLPVKYRDRIIGCLNIASHTLNEVDHWSRLAVERIVTHIGAAIVHARQEDAIKSSEARYRSLVEMSPDAIYILIDGKFVFSNRVGGEILGVDDATYLQGKSFLHFVQKDYRSLVQCRLDGDDTQMMQGSPVELKMVRLDGSDVDVEITQIPFSSDGKEAIQIVVRDITERQLLEKERSKSNRLESIGVLAGGIAHDFNNFLSGPMGEMQLLLMRKDLPEDAVESMVRAFEGLKRTEGLTNQLLTFAKGSAPVKETTAIQEVIQDIVQLSLRGSNTKPVYHFSEDLSAVDLDVGQFAQVIQNLIINADQAMGQGGTVEILGENVALLEENTFSLPAGRYVHISVADEGKGIPRDLVEKIFEPFFTTKTKGSGLGLAITYAIIKKHAGGIYVHSTPNMGTTFHIYLPASERVFSPVVEKNMQSFKGSGRILLMDDDFLIQKMLKRVLTTAGYLVTVVETGECAVDTYLSALDEKPFDAVIMDLTVPGSMGGKGAIQRIREIDPEVRAIVTSGYATNPVMAEYEAYGFKARVKKPIDIDELTNKLHIVLQTGG